jgi:glycosyltransferase involved in cell wall biosynthesis
MSAASASRPFLAMLMAHDPSLDPRIDWEASSAAARFDVVALGLHGGREGAPAREDIRGYRLRRLAATRGTGTTLAFAAAWLRVIGWRDRVVAAALLLAGGWLLLLMPLIGHGLMFAGARSERLKRAVCHAWRHYAALRHGYQFFQEINWCFAPAAAVLWRELRDSGRTPAVVHCNDLDTLLVGVLARRAWGARLVYDAHEFRPYSQADAGWYYRPFFRFYEASLIGQCDAVVTVNPMLAGVMALEYGLESVLSVPNAEPWRDGISRRRSEVSDLAGARVKVLFQGAFSPERGIEELIRAWRHIDGSAAALFLRGPRNELRDACAALAGELGLLGHSVYFVDPIAEAELVPASMEADVGVIPYQPTLINHRYCCPNKLSQYLQAGIMILCNDLPYVKQVVADAQAGLAYDGKDEASLVEALRRAIADPGLRERCGRNGREHARRAFHWQQFYPVLESAYLGGPAAAARPAGGSPA